MIRYVERNALRAGLVERAEDWRWCSLWRRERAGVCSDGEGRDGEGSDGEGGAAAAAAAARVELADWPVPRPADWVERVNRPETDAELAALRLSLRRGRPYGSEPWQRRTVERFGLEFTLRPPHRPAKH